MRCPKCEKELPEGSVFCKYCGSPINTEQKEKQVKLPEKITYGDIAFYLGIGSTVIGTAGLCVHLYCFVLAIVLGIVGLIMCFRLKLHNNKDSKSKASIILNIVGIAVPSILLMICGFAALYFAGSLITEITGWFN